MITKNSFEYVVCSRLYKIKYLLQDFVKMNNPCYCKTKLYEFISIFVSKFIIHNVYLIDNRIIPNRSDIFNSYYKNYEFCCYSVSEFLLCFANKIVNFYYNFIYESYTDGLKYLFDNYDVKFFGDFIDDIIDKFFENTVVLISGFNVKCNKDMCVGKCRECLKDSRIGDVIRFYLFDEFIENRSELENLIDYVCKAIDCNEIDLIVDGRFLKSRVVQGIKDLKGLNNFKSLTLVDIECKP